MGGGGAKLVEEGCAECVVRINSERNLNLRFYNSNIAYTVITIIR